mmetsp:Transcript_2578/g.3507  ORF Transcript_2578/g.3507 Transcript_2578/m.3507 type:complete len:136 (+) Transcript_2578:137-544(+)
MIPFLIFLLLFKAQNAFYLHSEPMRQSDRNVQCRASRRSFIIDGGVTSVVSALISVSDIEDLSLDDAATISPKAMTEDERVRRKLKAQEEATGMKYSGRQSYQERTANELLKQKAMKKSAKQRQQDLCEELGRGC